MEIEPLSVNTNISTNIYKCFINNEEMNEEIIKQINLQGDKQNNTTPVKAQMTSWDMKEKPGFNKLALELINITSFIAKKINNFDCFNPSITGMWGIKYTSNQETKEHNHWPSVYSAAYYINPPKNSSVLSFPQLSLNIEPEHGLLVIFEGWVKHKVIPKPFNGFRYTVSANLKE